MNELIKPEDLRTFVAVVQQRSFTAAAAQLGLPRPTVSRQIARLEAAVGLRLLHRTTRAVAPTDAGLDVLSRAKDALAALDHVATAADLAAGQPRGRLRIAAPPTMGPLLCRALILEMLDDYPALAIDMQLTPRAVDLVAEDFDLAIRMGPVLDDRLVRIPLGQIERWIVGPAASRVDHPEQLDGRLLCFSPEPVTVHRDQERSVVRPHHRLHINDYGVLWAAAQQGLGAAAVPHPMCHPAALERAGLVRLLPDWSLPAEPAHLLRPSGRVTTPRIREFVRRLKQRAEGPDWPLRLPDPKPAP